MIREAIDVVVGGRSLTVEEAAQSMEEIMTGEATSAQFGAFVTALRLKGETVDEITGMAQVMREKSLHVNVEGSLVDTCGTGGDASGTFNISTTAAFVVAGAGVKVAKHGNRAMSGACGSADVLEGIGGKIDLGPEGVQRCLEETGFGFMFAQTFHPAMRFAAGPRREIGIRTVFNILGPLTNPAGAKSQVIGVADPSMARKMAEVLGKLGSTHALVVHGGGGLDEISLSGPTQVWEMQGGSVLECSISPGDVGLSASSSSAIQAVGVEASAQILRDVLAGKTGPARDIVLFNAAAALLAADRVTSIKDGVGVAAAAIDSGRAQASMESFVKLSQSLSFL
jgi:anthranilate phosphoribosyltransferase